MADYTVPLRQLSVDESRALYEAGWRQEEISTWGVFTSGPNSKHPGREYAGPSKGVFKTFLDEIKSPSGFLKLDQATQMQRLYDDMYKLKKEVSELKEAVHGNVVPGPQ